MRHSKSRFIESCAACFNAIGMKGRDLVDTVSNCADAVRLQTAPTGGESVYLFWLIKKESAKHSEKPSFEEKTRFRLHDFLI